MARNERTRGFMALGRLESSGLAGASRWAARRARLGGAPGGASASRLARACAGSVAWARLRAVVTRRAGIVRAGAGSGAVAVPWRGSAGHAASRARTEREAEERERGEKGNRELAAARGKRRQPGRGAVGRWTLVGRLGLGLVFFRNAVLDSSKIP
jgi:hypothetical protein